MLESGRETRKKSAPEDYTSANGRHASELILTELDEDDIVTMTTMDDEARRETVIHFWFRGRVVGV